MHARRLGIVIAGISAALAGGGSTGASAEQRTYANPVDIDYRYNFEQINNGVSYRTGADPAVVNHKGAYYLFLTLADGYWRSTDLIHWNFITPSQWPNGGIVAPAVASDGDRLIIQPSNSFTQPSSIYVSTAPETGRLDYLVRRFPDMPGVADKPPEQMKPGEVPPGPWDPGLLKDDDGQWYLYWDSSNVFPIYGQKIAFADGKLIYQSPAVPLLLLHPEEHGWERFGQDHSGLLANGQPTRPYLEGAWMTKVGRRYYLQYGAPGTEFNAYANGTYVSDKPLGPFSYAPYNPIAYKPGGFVHGAGHGSTFQDRYGNWWNSGTPWIGYNWTFERRMAMFPAGFDKDGVMFSNTRFGDFPHFAPTSKWTNRSDLFTGWMLLSYRKPATATSGADGFPAANVTDENPRTFWVAGAKETAIMGLMPWLEMGWNVVNVEYRLGVATDPSTLAPAAVDDCFCALRFVASLPATYNIDKSRIVVTGESAGGHLALAMGIIPESAGLGKECAGAAAASRSTRVNRWSRSTGPSVTSAASRGSGSADGRSVPPPVSRRYAVAN